MELFVHEWAPRFVYDVHTSDVTRTPASAGYQQVVITRQDMLQCADKGWEEEDCW